MLARTVVILAVAMLSLGSLHASGVDPENLKEYGKGIIKDYSDMNESEDIEWLWVAPKVQLSTYQFKLKPVENLTDLSDSDMEETINEGLPKVLKRVGSKDGPTLQVESAVYWAQRANRSKMWIPVVGGHVAQAGVGVELVFKNSKNEIVAKIRHSGREGDKLEDAAQELVDDIAKFVKTH